MGWYRHVCRSDFQLLCPGESTLVPIGHDNMPATSMGLSSLGASWDAIFLGVFHVCLPLIM
jgi:hypothetical protein